MIYSLGKLRDEGDGGKLWDAMRKQSHVTDGKKAVCTFLNLDSLQFPRGLLRKSG
jgi:hypothetical protein